jgi:ProP effector
MFYQRFPGAVFAARGANSEGGGDTRDIGDPGAPVKLLDITATIALLAERWPKTFSVYDARRQPLKLHIDIEIRAALGDTVPGADLSRALTHYTHSLAYLDRCRAGAARIDLDGNAVDTVTEAQAARAAAIWANVMRRKAARRAERKREQERAKRKLGHLPMLTLKKLRVRS